MVHCNTENITFRVWGAAGSGGSAFLNLEQEAYLMDWLRRMMAGRRGLDQLGLAMLILSIVFIVLSRFWFYLLFSLLSLILLTLCLFRMFSRDAYRRQGENRRFMGFWEPMGRRFQGWRANLSDSKTHCHFKCPACGQKVRVPRNRGKIAIVCPRCRASFVRKT